MHESVVAIVNRPGPADLELLERLATRLNLLYVSVLSPGDRETADWFSERGVQQHGELSAVPEPSPGALLLHLADAGPGEDVYREAASRGMSVLTREAVLALAGDQPGALSRTAMVERFRRLLDDYFPSSKSTSTTVKIAACLAEVATLWGATGVALFAREGDPGALRLLEQRGLGLPRDFEFVPDEGTALGRACASGGAEVIGDLSSGVEEPLPGVIGGSAACVPVGSGPGSTGVLLVFSDKPDMFAASDLSALTVFAYYAALLLAYDELGERLGDNLLTDALTGLLNRRQFATRLEQEVSRAQRYTLTVTLVLFSVDNFRGYVAACGDMLGNLALSDIASILSRGTREVDLAARVADDRFAAILPETNRLGALQLAYRLRSDVASYPFPTAEDNPAVPLGLSAGVASFPSSAADTKELLSRAEEALQSAIKRGPNTIKLYDE
ncbi:MAG: sensor domain-containing diguanylate cyclase [Actinomycetota bacterium]